MKKIKVSHYRILAGVGDRTPRTSAPARHRTILLHVMKRTPLQRYTPLARSTKPMASMRPGKRKARRAFSSAVMALNGGYCVRCWLTFGRYRLADDPHHWLPLARGGTDAPSNGLPMCRHCHNWIHRFPKLAEAAGWLLRAHGGMNEAVLGIHTFLLWSKTFWENATKKA